MKNNGIGHLVLVGKDSTLENRWPSVKWKISMPCSPTIPNYCRAQRSQALLLKHTSEMRPLTAALFRTFPEQKQLQLSISERMINCGNVPMTEHSTANNNEQNNSNMQKYKIELKSTMMNKKVRHKRVYSQCGSIHMISGWMHRCWNC